MNEMRGLFSGHISIVNRPRYRGHISLDVVHAVNAGQLQIKRATAEPRNALERRAAAARGCKER
jgi:hypothetical protein